MNLVLLLFACEAAPLPEPTAAPAEEPRPKPPADWSRTLDIAAAVASYYVDQTIRQKPPRTRMTIEDSGAARVRTVILRTQREVAMPVDDDTAHWLVDCEDADTGEVVTLDFTLEWDPPPPEVELPGHSYRVSAVEIQAVAGVERHRWIQEGERWTRQPSGTAADVAAITPTRAAGDTERVAVVDGAAVRSHADMLHRIVARSAADPSWLDELATLADAGGRVTFVVGATDDTIGWRVEGDAVALRDAIAVVAERHVGADRARALAAWTQEGPYAAEVAVGSDAWSRFEAASTVTGVRASLGGKVPPRELDAVLGTRSPTFELWLGAWSGADGKSGYSVATRARPESDVIVDGNIAVPGAMEERQVLTTRWIPGGSALSCVDALTKAGASGHGQRLGKAFAELRTDACGGVRERGYGDSRWWGVEIVAK